MATFQKRGAKWRAIVRKKGHPAQSKTFSTKARAQAWAKQLEGQLEDAEAGIRPTLTLGEILDAHLVHLERTSSRGRKNGASHRTLCRGLGRETLITALGYRDLADFCESRLEVDEVKPATTLHDVMYLSGAITTAVVEGRLPEGMREKAAAWRNGLQRAGLVGRPQSRDRRPTPEELELLITHTKHNHGLRIGFHDLIRFAVESSMRLDEICSLRWEDIDLEGGTAIVRLRKHPTDKQDQLVPLMGESVDILRGRPEGEGPFAYRPESVSNGFRRICRHLGIDDLHFHDLRHEGISRLFERGMPVQEVAMVSGHRDWGSLRRYTNLKAGEVAAKYRRKD